MALPQTAVQDNRWDWLSGRNLTRTLELIQLLTLRELKLRYQGTALGYLWSLAKPLLSGLVMYVVLGQIIKVGIPNYHLFLLSALFPWAWFQGSVFLAAPSFANNGKLLKKVYFPRFVLPLSSVTHNFVHFALSLPVLVILLALSGTMPDLNWVIGIPVLIIIQLLLLMGIVLIVATIDVFFRDLEHLVDVGLNLVLFYLTPILYSIEMVPAQYRWVTALNPVAPLIESWRRLFIEGRLPELALIWPTLVFIVVALPFSAWLFRALEEHFEDAL
jgi:ABC-type polysaccharide/polyol phosphate export permease